MSSGPDCRLPTASWCGLTKASRDMREAFVCASLGQCRANGSKQAAGTHAMGRSGGAAAPPAAAGTSGLHPQGAIPQEAQPKAVRRTVIVSRGFAPGAGRFPLCGKLSLQPRAAGSEATSERLPNSKKWPAGHFVDAPRQSRFAAALSRRKITSGCVRRMDA